MYDSDVLIIGAGPAGCVSANLLRQSGLHVRILEKQRFPRFVIGESLLPQIMSILDRADLLDCVNGAAYQLKNGAVFHCGGRKTEFSFADKCTTGPSETFQVQRAHFDHLLSQRAQELGTDIKFGETVTAVSLALGNCKLESTNQENQQHTYTSRFVLDASGYGRVLAQQLQLNRPSHYPPRSSLFTHIQDHISDPDYDRDKILILVHPRFHQIWYWLIPFADGTASIGVVAEPDHLNNLKLNDDDLLRTLIRQEPLLHKILHNAQFQQATQRIDSYAQDVKQLHGDGYALLGNAASFLDPVFSSGVTIALNSAALACPLVIKSLSGQSVNWDDDYSTPLNKGVEVFKHCVDGWYGGNLQDIILHDKPETEVKRQISAVLAGYAWDSNNPFVKNTKRRIASIGAFCKEQTLSAAAHSKQATPIYLNDIGIINSMGHDAESILSQFTNKTSPLRPQSGLLPQKDVLVGAVPTQLPKIPNELAQFNSRNNRLALAAYQQIESSVEYYKQQYGAQRIAVIIGTSTSGNADTEKDFIHFQQHQRHRSDFHYQQYEIGSVSSFIRHYAGLKSFDYSISTACTSSAKAILSGMHLIRSGLCDAAIVGGVDSLCKLTVNGFSALHSVSDSIANPFSINRNGLNIGEAACLFVMSKKQSEIALFGGGENSDAHHISAPDPTAVGAENCMLLALEDAKLTAEDIDYINLHGTGTELNDHMEAHAVSRIFKNHVPCSSSKPLTGHCLGAAGATELGLCWLSLSSQNSKRHIPRHLWDAHIDTTLPIIALADTDQSLNKLDICMSNSFAFGGNNVSIILGRSRL